MDQISSSFDWCRAKDNGVTGYYWKGQIDEVMLYNRALSRDEIQAIINVRDVIPPLVGSVLINNGADNTTSDTLTLTLTSRDASPIVAYSGHGQWQFRWVVVAF